MPKASPEYVAASLRDFLDGSGGAYDWGDFVGIRVADPRLEDIRREAAGVELPLKEDGRAILEALLARAEALEQRR
ncbi:MAG TPA: hypothetical protein PKY87_09085 [Terricaulis sp.]|nr:hypothetical protein [Terricaulis sp.]